MAEKKGVGHAFNVDFLNVVFAASSLFLFLSVVWMVWDDFDREWKNTQRQFARLEYQVTQAQLQQAQRGVDKNKIAQLQAQAQAGQKTIDANKAKVDEIQDKLKDVDKRLFKATIDFQTTKATYDQDRYLFEAARARNDSGWQKQQQHVDELLKQQTDQNLEVEKIQAEKGALQTELGKYTGQLATAQKAIEDAQGEQTRLAKRLTAIGPSLVKDYFQNAPLLDFMAPTLKIQQVILPNVMDDVNFIRVPKMDRCTTCHLAIDKKGYEKYP